MSIEESIGDPHCPECAEPLEPDTYKEYEALCCPLCDRPEVVVFSEDGQVAVSSERDSSVTTRPQD